MKVLLIARNLNNKEGTGRHTNEIKRALQSRGIAVSVLVEPLLFSLSNFSIINFLANIIRARKESGNFDIVHSLDIWPYGVYGYFAVLGTKKKFFMNGIGTYSILPTYGAVKKFLMRRAFLRANQTFCISDYTKKRILEDINLKNISTVFYGTVELPALNEKQIKDYKEIYKIKDEFPILLTVGAVKERKGQLDTLKAANLIKTQHPNFKYVMIGNSSDKYYVQKIIGYAGKNGLNDNYRIISDADDKILPFFYQICDVFLLNSNTDGAHFEGFGLVLLEAAQFGKPVIGSRGCGIESALKDGYNGYLTEQKNPEDIKEKILMVIKNKKQLSRNSKEFCKNFSWDKTISEYIKYYEQMV